MHDAVEQAYDTVVVSHPFIKCGCKMLFALVCLNQGLTATAIGNQPTDQFRERDTIPLPERRALTLPMVRENDEVVGAWRACRRAFERREELIQRRQCFERIGAVDPRVMRDLVVAEQRCVDRREAVEHISDERESRRFLQEYGAPGPNQRVAEGTPDAWLHVPYTLLP